jgi:hypothetical protein
VTGIADAFSPRMSIRRYLRIASLLGAAGVAFAGYLSYTRLASGVCAFDEPCPFFLGHPACHTGLALFAAAFFVSAGALALGAQSARPVAANAVIGGAGSLFAGWLAMGELAKRSDWTLGLPTCAYGFVFFLVLLVLSLSVWIKLEVHHGTPHHSA